MSVFTSQIQNKPWLPQVTILAMVLGGLLALSFKTQDRIRGENLPGMRPGQLAAAYKDLNQTSVDQKKQIADLQKNLLKYQKAATDETGNSKLLYNDLEKANIAAGLIAVTGPGVIVTLLDSQKMPTRPANMAEETYIEISRPYIIHDSDIQTVVNELRAAGAEAISINDQRVVATTAIRCVGPTVTVNNVTTNGSPVKIKAIGDPETMTSALFIHQGVADQMRFADPQMFSLDKTKSLTLPAFVGANTFRFAKPAVENKADQAQRQSENAGKTGNKPSEDPDGKQ